MLKIRAGWGALVSAGLCLWMATSVFAADENWVIKRTQEAEINGSFNRYNGVSNTNSAAGNLNNQTAISTISIAGGTSGFAADNYFTHQGYSGFFIVGNSVYGQQGVSSQNINSENNRIVVQQRTVGFLVDGRNTVGLAAISHSFQNYTGIATINQAAGNLNNQVSMAGVINPSQSLSAVHAGSPLRVYSNISHNMLLLNSGSSYKAVIDGGSFRNYSGMLAVSQTAGNMNNTVNYVGLSMNAAPGIGQPLSNNHLGNVTALNKKNDNVIKGKGECPEVNIETGAFRNFTGVASITQVAGNMNQVVTQVGVSVH